MMEQLETLRIGKTSSERWPSADTAGMIGYTARTGVTEILLKRKA